VNARLFTPRALRDLRQAALWIAEDNPNAGEALLNAALRAAERLAARPALDGGGPSFC
jgi:plasmid stabilization system protein ParE